MRPSPAFLLAACLLAAACRTTYHVVKDVGKLTVGTVKLAGGTAIGTTKLAIAIIKDFDYYAKKAVALRKNHDSRPLHGADVVKVLGRGGKRGKYPKLPAYSGEYRWPLAAGVVSSEFGARWGKKHEGIDIAADTGEPVLASAAGRVEYAGGGLRGYGNVVVLRHDEQTTTLYGHNSALKVKTGELVKPGQTIALLGSTGHSTGPHVHFEIRKGKTPADPRARLPKSRF